MSTGRSAPAHRLLTEALDALDHAADPAATDAELLSVLTVCEGAQRRFDLVAVRTVAALQRRGAFTDRGYKNPISAVADLLGCEWVDARRRVLGAEQVCERVGLDGAVLPDGAPSRIGRLESGRPTRTVRRSAREGARPRRSRVASPRSLPPAGGRRARPVLLSPAG